MSTRSLLIACVLALFCLMPLTGCAPSDGGGDGAGGNGGGSGGNNTTAAE